MEPFFETLAVTEADLLSESDCTDIVSALQEMRQYWIHRHIVLPFYTMGVASYMDATNQVDRLAYCSNAHFYNPVLREHFGWVYERLADSLSRILQNPVRYDDRYAIPGFHIFLASQVFAQPRASIHCDLQYSLLDWSMFESADFENPISFTLSIALPISGGGLYLWDLQKEEWTGLPETEVNRLMRTRKRIFQPYHVGGLVIHSGHHVHQIAPMVDPQPDDKRITLQGHGLLCQGTWQLYW